LHCHHFWPFQFERILQSGQPKTGGGRPTSTHRTWSAEPQGQGKRQEWRRQPPGGLIHGDHCRPRSALPELFAQVLIAFATSQLHFTCLPNKYSHSIEGIRRGGGR